MVLTLAFYASKFCYCICFGAGFSGGQGNFLRLQIIFKFCCSYFFLVFAFYFFCCCGLGQGSEDSALFGCCWLVLFFVCSFHFIPQVKVFLFFGCSFRWTIWLSAFLKTVFKIIPGLCSAYFLLQQFSVDSVSLFCTGNFCVGTQ